MKRKAIMSIAEKKIESHYTFLLEMLAGCCLFEDDRRALVKNSQPRSDFCEIYILSLSLNPKECLRGAREWGRVLYEQPPMHSRRSSSDSTTETLSHMQERENIFENAQIYSISSRRHSLSNKFDEFIVWCRRFCENKSAEVAEWDERIWEWQDDRPPWSQSH